MRYKVSGAIAIPKASWGCAPALPNRIQMVSLRITIPNQKPQANKKFFDPAIFQKCWRGSGRVALIAARRQRNPCAMLLAHGGGGEKSESFSRRRTRPPRLVKLERETSILQLFRGNSCNEMFHGKHFEIASRETIWIRFGKAGAHPQLAWESQLPLKPCISLQPFNF